MPNLQYIQSMARYNMWQNTSMVKAASSLTDAYRKKDRGVFFKSIHNTFAHILWGDQLWLSRFSTTQAPKGGIEQSVSRYEDWEVFCKARSEFDKVILDWTKTVSEEWFLGDLSWFSGAIGKNISKPKSLLTIQMFNHQTHHRGQIHAMLTSTGIKTDDTDIPFMPNTYLQI